MKVSFIIITRNRIDLLKRAVKSAITQTGVESEIIVIDDDSSCENEEYINSLNENIIYYKFPSNVGANKCRNKGAEIANGTFVAFLDDDDEWSKNKIIKQLKSIDFNEDTLVYTGKKILYSKEGEVYRKKYNFSEPKYPNNLKLSIMLKNFIGTTSSILMSKKMFFDSGRFDVKMKALQDYEFYVRIINKGYKVHGVNESLLNYYEFSDKQNISNNFRRNLHSCKNILKINKNSKYYWLFLISVTKIFFYKTLKTLKSVLN